MKLNVKDTFSTVLKSIDQYGKIFVAICIIWNPEVRSEKKDSIRNLRDSKGTTSIIP